LHAEVIVGVEGSIHWVSMGPFFVVVVVVFALGWDAEGQGDRIGNHTT
jgi:hypothetical protein